MEDDRPKSGVRGVTWDSNHSAWVAWWYTDGKRKAKRFQTAVYGNEKALEMAQDHREKMVAENEAKAANPTSRTAAAGASTSSSAAPPQRQRQPRQQTRDPQELQQSWSFQQQQQPPQLPQHSHSSSHQQHSHHQYPQSPPSQRSAGGSSSLSAMSALGGGDAGRSSLSSRSGSPPSRFQWGGGRGGALSPKEIEVYSQREKRKRALNPETLLQNLRSYSAGPTRRQPELSTPPVKVEPLESRALPVPFGSLQGSALAALPPSASSSSSSALAASNPTPSQPSQSSGGGAPLPAQPLSRSGVFFNDLLNAYEVWDPHRTSAGLRGRRLFRVSAFGGDSDKALLLAERCRDCLEDYRRVEEMHLAASAAAAAAVASPSSSYTPVREPISLNAVMIDGIEMGEPMEPISEVHGPSLRLPPIAVRRHEVPYRPVQQLMGSYLQMGELGPTSLCRGSEDSFAARKSTSTQAPSMSMSMSVGGHYGGGTMSYAPTEWSGRSPDERASVTVSRGGGRDRGALSAQSENSPPQASSSSVLNHPRSPPPREGDGLGGRDALAPFPLQAGSALLQPSGVSPSAASSSSRVAEVASGSSEDVRSPSRVIRERGPSPSPGLNPTAAATGTERSRWAMSSPVLGLGGTPAVGPESSSNLLEDDPCERPYKAFRLNSSESADEEDLPVFGIPTGEDEVGNDPGGTGLGVGTDVDMVHGGTGRAGLAGIGGGLHGGFGVPGDGFQSGRAHDFARSGRAVDAPFMPPNMDFMLSLGGEDSLLGGGVNADFSASGRAVDTLSRGAGDFFA